MTIELGKNGMHRPNENTGIPVKVTTAHERLGEIRIRLLAETNDLERVGIPDLLAPLDVTEARAGPGGRDADGNQVPTLLGDARGTSEIRLKCCLVGDSMIGGQHDHGRGRVAGGNDPHPECDRCGGVPFCGFGQNIVLRKVRQ